MYKTTYQVSENDSDEPYVTIESFSAKDAAEEFVSAYVDVGESECNVEVTVTDGAIVYKYEVEAKCSWTYRAKRVT